MDYKHVGHPGSLLFQLGQHKMTYGDYRLRRTTSSALLGFMQFIDDLNGGRW